MEEGSYPLPEVIAPVVSVVACGPSALKCGAALAPGYVIAVNDAYQHVRFDAAVSMDGRWALHRITDFGGRAGLPLYLRRRALGKLGGFNEALWPRVRVFECDNHSATFGEHDGQLNGQNSGYCALNLAYLMRPGVVYLFGFDHTGKHFHEENEWTKRGEGSRNGEGKFRIWADDCKTARAMFDAQGTRVVNTNHFSKIQAFDFGQAALRSDVGDSPR